MEIKDQQKQTERNLLGFEDSGVVIHRVPNKSRWSVLFRLKDGTGRFVLDGVDIGELIKTGSIAPTVGLRELMDQEEFKAWDTDLVLDGPGYSDVLEPVVLARALEEVLANILERLIPEEEEPEQ